MCYSGLCPAEDHMGDCTWNKNKGPYPCHEAEEAYQEQLEREREEAERHYENEE